MCGCDYTHSIGGMGPVTSYKMLKEHDNIEGVLDEVKRLNEEREEKDPTKGKRFVIPDKFLYEESRDLFKNPEVIDDKEILEKKLVWDKPNEEGLKEWLIGSKCFTETKVSNGIERLNKCQGKKNQSRLDSFFKSTMISSKKTEAPKGKGGKNNKGA